jgi:hypothetical protein
MSEPNKHNVIAQLRRMQDAGEVLKRTNAELLEIARRYAIAKGDIPVPVNVAAALCLAKSLSKGAD